MLAFGFLALPTACTQPPSESTAAFIGEQRRRELADSAGYETRPATDPNGISKYYMGRQIAHVMGHEGADWLERPNRQEDERTDRLLHEMKLRPTDVVADIGAGTGYFTFRISPLVPRGKVLAVDIQPQMIAELNAGKVRRKTPNVEPVLGTTDDPNLPAGQVDLVLLVDAYHEFDHPREMMRAIRTSLSPTGRVVLAEYRAEDPSVPIKRIHKMSVEQVVKEMNAVGLELADSVGVLPQQHLLFFQKAR